MPKFTLNGQEVEAKPGQTIIQAAADHGMEIPHYCYHPDLPIDGNCRMCLVEVEKMPKLTPACTTLVNDGMVVRSENERVKEAVRGVQAGVSLGIFSTSTRHMRQFPSIGRSG